MISIAESMRNFWLPDLHKVSGRVDESLAKWICKEEFVFTSITSSSEFTIKVLNPKSALSGIAFDCNKMASAAFETFIEISDSKILPKSCAWINLSAYYGSFYAAHAILRLCGTICFQVENPQKIALERVAHITGCLPTKGIDGGFYMGRYDSVSNEFVLHKTSAGTSGSHNVMWKIFNDELVRFAEDLNNMSQIYSDSVNFLREISALLCKTSSNGNWLSSIRNEINYKLAHGTWFPYKDLKTTKASLINVASCWKLQPEKIKLRYPNDLVSQQVATSAAIVSLCKLIILDMASIYSKNFHMYGPVSLLKQCKFL